MSKISARDCPDGLSRNGDLRSYQIGVFNTHLKNLKTRKIPRSLTTWYSKGSQGFQRINYKNANAIDNSWTKRPLEQSFLYQLPALARQLSSFKVADGATSRIFQFLQPTCSRKDVEIKDIDRYTQRYTRVRDLISTKLKRCVTINNSGNMSFHRRCAEEEIYLIFTIADSFRYRMQFNTACRYAMVTSR